MATQLHGNTQKSNHIFNFIIFFIKLTKLLNSGFWSHSEA